MLTAFSTDVDGRERSLSHTQWHLVRDAIEPLPPGLARERLRFILTFAYSTGCRATELVAACTWHLRRYEAVNQETGALETYDMFAVLGIAK